MTKKKPVEDYVKEITQIQTNVEKCRSKIKCNNVAIEAITTLCKDSVNRMKPLKSSHIRWVMDDIITKGKKLNHYRETSWALDSATEGLRSNIRWYHKKLTELAEELKKEHNVIVVNGVIK